MKKSIRIKALIVCFACILTACGIEIYASFHTSHAMIAFEDMFYGNRVEVTYSEAPGSVAGFDARPGLLMKTQAQGASVRFVDIASGPFEMEYRAVSEKTGIYDLESLRLIFTDVYTADSFAVEIGLTEDGFTGPNSTDPTCVRAVVDTGLGKGFGVDEGYKWLTAYGVSIGSSYCNQNSDSIAVRFDPASMEVSVKGGKSSVEYLVIDLDNAAHLKQTGRETPMSDFAEYSVEVEFARFSSDAKSAAIMVYSLFGSDIDSRFLANTASANVYVNTKQSAKVGEPYDLLKNVTVYDLINGVTAFKGRISVVDPEGNAVGVADNSFTPTVSGTYTLLYTPENSQSTATAYLKAVSYGESFSYAMSRAFSDTAIGVNSTLILPAVTVNSNYSDRGNLQCSVSVVKGGSVLFTSNASAETEYLFDEEGEYEIVYAVMRNGEKAAEKAYNVTVSGGIPAFIGDSVKSTYTCGETLTVPKKTAVLGGSTYQVTACVIFEDGRENGYSSVLLDTVGQCEVRYTAVADDKTFIYSEVFSVNKSPAGLWENLGGITVTNNVDLPEYADVYGNGVMLSTSRTGTGVRYANTLDLSNSNLQTPIIQAMFTPDDAGTQEFKNFEIRLIDVNDETNYLTIQLSTFTSNYTYITYVVCGANLGYDPVGNIGKKMGSRVDSSMLGKYNDRYGCYRSLPFEIYYDAKEKAVYAGPNAGGKQTLAIVARLADASFVGEGNEWDGFSTGEVRMELRINSLSYSSAHVTVLSVLGQSMAGEYISDTTPPSIILSGYDEANVPKAVIDKPYKIFQGELFDAVEGDLGDITDISVYYFVSGVKTYLPIVDGKFTPVVAGMHYVEYFGMDGAKNAAQRTIAIEAVSSVPSLKYQLSGDIKTSALVGELAEFPIGKASGGSGRIEITRTVCFENEEYEATDEFRFLRVGTYYYKIKLTDYIGQTEEFTYPITVEESDGPLVTEKPMPKALIVGHTYTLPEFIAIKYEDGASKELPVTITVNGTKLDKSRTFTPLEEEILNVCYSADGYEKTFILNAVLPDDSEKFLEKYFVSTDGSVKIDVEDEYTVFETNGSSATDGFAEVSFINPLGMSENHIEFVILQNNFTKLNIYLTDSEDASKHLKFTVAKSSSVGSTSIFTLNDGYEKIIAGSFYEGQTRLPITIKMRNGKIYDYEDTLLAAVDTYLSGKLFDGFSSGRVYLSFEFEGVTGESSIGLRKLWNQSFGATYGDYISPIISVGSMDGKVLLGDVITLPEISAFDVLDPTLTLRLSVKCGSVYLKDLDGHELNGVIMQPNKQYSFVADQFGKYEIQIETTDSSRNIYNYSKVFYVDGTVDPTLMINGNVKSSYKVGEKITVPTAAAADYRGNELRVYIYIVDISGRYHILADGYVFAEAGKYTVVYYAYDEFGNYAMQQFIITVGE